MQRLKTFRRIVLFAAVVALLGQMVLGVQPAALAAKSYSVTFKANGGQGTMPAQLLPTTGKALGKVRFTKVGYRFAGWATSASGTARFADRAVFKPRARTLLYAKWAPQIAPQILLDHKIGGLLWSDEFTGAAGSQVSDANFTTRFCGHAATNGGGTCHNSEPQWYTPDAIALDGTAQGNAVITTTHVTSIPQNVGECLAGVCNFTSGRFDTQGKVSFQYGYIEARMKMPVGGANWPAFWALGDSISTIGWPSSGEIDIAEQGGDRPTRASSAVHYSDDGLANCCGNHLYEVNDIIDRANYQAGFHTYGMAWTPGRMEFYVDGELFWIVTPSTIRSSFWAFDAPYFLIFDNATGPFGGAYSGWSQSFTYIDYVRAWKLDGYGQVVRH